MSTLAGLVGAPLRDLGYRLEQVPKEIRTEVRRAVREAGDDVRRTAQSNASWSTRISSSIQVRTQFQGARAGVYIAASSRVAPHARAYEGITGRTTIRHPLNWPNQRRTRRFAETPVRPFLEPALAVEDQAAVNRLADAVNAALDSL